MTVLESVKRLFRPPPELAEAVARNETARRDLEAALSLRGDDPLTVLNKIGGSNGSNDD